MIRSKQTNTTISASYGANINYKDVDLLKIFITEQGKILPRRATGITVQQQRRLAKAVKRARILALLPFVTSNQNQ